MRRTHREEGGGREGSRGREREGGKGWGGHRERAREKDREIWKAENQKWRSAERGGCVI